MTAIHEITCKSLLNKSGIPGIDYTVNPYTGCVHACAYCYARFMSRHTKHGLAWGTFCDVKVNAVQILEKELLRRPVGLVSLSTVTDPYQPAEQKYRLTREILIRLAEAEFPISILTKSDLVLRDIDILRRFPRENCEVGFSINTLDENVRKQFEPGARPASLRTHALKTLHDAGIRTWLFAAPVLPVLTEESIFTILEEIKGRVDHVLFDALNIKCGNWKSMSPILQGRPDSQTRQWREILFSNENKASYYDGLFRRCVDFCAVRHIPMEIC
jgi:DNA repair photolyase